jgi:ribosomal protein L16 Arg81 hydroxylase
MLHEIADELKKEKPALFRNAVQDLFSWSELENLLNLRPFVNADRMKTVNENPYSWQRQAWMTDVNCFPPSLLDGVIRENLCLLIDASRTNHKINTICKQLEDTFIGGASDAHIYFTLSDNVADTFGIHWDFSHNLIVQVAGETEFKAWDLWSSQDRNVQSLPEPPVIETLLTPGDAVFVPKHYYHLAQSKTKRLSISFPVSFGDELASQDRHWIRL